MLRPPEEADPMPFRSAALPCLVALAACSYRVSETASPAPVVHASTPDALFGFETREHQLWMHSIPDGFLYTVKSVDGRVLAERIDEAQLGAAYPELHAVLDEGVDY
jgi:hypothetical protein